MILNLEAANCTHSRLHHPSHCVLLASPCAPTLPFVGTAMRDHVSLARSNEVVSRLISLAEGPWHMRTRTWGTL